MVKVLLYHIALLFIAVCCCSVYSANAQEGAYNEFESIDTERDKLERERILYSPGEGETRYIGRSNSSSSVSTTPASKETPKEQVSRDPEVKSTSASSAKTKSESSPKPVEKPPVPPTAPKENADNILSFNFLYYIIQKYKLQDIVD